jgi:soluble cytochrome b562
MKITLDDRTKDYIDRMLQHEKGFKFLVDEISKKLTSEQANKLRAEVNEALETMKKIYNEYKE